ncbi:MAG: hypothetical protein H6715_01845 [Myxococcales bacterium]|nr:hypothetical protein [Myxococcales bacterium]MCB9707569.1 hypothetical protein [Myxococcales bacterium]
MRLALRLGIVGTKTSLALRRKTAAVVGILGCFLPAAGCFGGQPQLGQPLTARDLSVRAPAPARTNGQTAWQQSKRGGFVRGETEHKYPLTITAPAVVRLVLDDISKGQDYDLSLVTEKGRELYSSRTMDDRGEYIETGFLEPGTYRISVSNFRGDVSTRAYRLTVKVFGSDQSTKTATSNTSIVRDTSPRSRT